MLDSLHAFTDAIRGRPLLDFKSLFDNAACQCLPRLLLCGYRQNTSGKHGNGTVIEPGKGIDKATLSFHDLHQTIQRRVILKNPLAQDDIKTYTEKVNRLGATF